MGKMANIVICADGTWNRPEDDIEKNFPSNVLKLARSIAPDKGEKKQLVFMTGALVPITAVLLPAPPAEAFTKIFSTDTDTSSKTTHLVIEFTCLALVAALTLYGHYAAC